jgi:hypothetical protein
MPRRAEDFGAVDASAPTSILALNLARSCPYSSATGSPFPPHCANRAACDTVARRRRLVSALTIEGQGGVGVVCWYALVACVT